MPLSQKSLSRREFARLFAIGGSATILGHQKLVGSKIETLVEPLLASGKVDWEKIQSQFLIPPELTVLNAAIFVHLLPMFLRQLQITLNVWIVNRYRATGQK